MAEDWLQPLLREWASWYMSTFDGANNHDASSILWRAVHAPIKPPPGSRIPNGALPPPGLNKIQLAMNNLLQSEYGEAIRVVRCWYCLGEQKTLEELRLTRRTMYRRKGAGESAIRRFLQA